jgi:polysaccharide export outer membrane protein
MPRHYWTLLIFLLSSLASAQQNPPSGSTPLAATTQWNEKLAATSETGSGAVVTDHQAYKIGAEDLIEITVFEVPELSRTVRVSTGGDITLPLVGTAKAAGLSASELEQALAEALRKNYVKDPQVSVFVKEYRSDPISIVGAVKVPGVYQIQSQKTLIEALAMAQGFSESARLLPGRMIVVTHKTGPNSRMSGTARPETEEVPIKALLESGDPKWNIPIFPGDVIRVVPAGNFYVAGDVNQPGSFPLTDFDNVSSIQAMAMAGGTKKTAKLKEAVIIRRDASGNRVEETIDLKAVLDGKAADTKLGANDVLFIPGSVGKAAGLRGIEAALQVATGVLVFGL